MSGCASRTTNSDSYVRAGYDFEDHDLVAIVDVVGEIKGERAKNQVADLFTLQLLRKGFAPVQREHVMRLLSEEGFEKGDLSPEAYAIEAGQVLQVPAVLIISVPTFGTEASLTAKIIEVKNGSALWLGSGARNKTNRDWIKVSDEPLGGSIFDSHFNNTMNPPEEGVVEEEDKTVALTPSELEPLKIIAEEICKSIPYRSQKAQPEKKPWFQEF